MKPTHMDLQRQTLAETAKAIKALRKRNHRHLPLLITLRAWLKTAGRAGLEPPTLASARGALLRLAEDALSKP